MLVFFFILLVGCGFELMVCDVYVLEKYFVLLFLELSSYLKIECYLCSWKIWWFVDRCVCEEIVCKGFELCIYVVFYVDYCVS